ncbi:MAG: hypothetical protein ABSE90_01235 [Verrucomicrobiota bacterium]|jgi:hypothetical protein
MNALETLRDWTCFDADRGKDLAKEVREYFIPDFGCTLTLFLTPGLNGVPASAGSVVAQASCL